MFKIKSDFKNAILCFNNPSVLNRFFFLSDVSFSSFSCNCHSNIQTNRCMPVLNRDLNLLTNLVRATNPIKMSLVWCHVKSPNDKSPR